MEYEEGDCDRYEPRVHAAGKPPVQASAVRLDPADLR
jgi:hypothetical protein